MTGSINLVQLNHYNIQAPPDKVEDVKRFYTDVIGLRAGPTPGKPDFPAYWLYLGEQPVVHLVGRPSARHAGEFVPKTTGWIDHVAFSCTGVEAARARLDELSVPYRFNDFPEAGISQFLVEDPLGVVIELNFFGKDR